MINRYFLLTNHNYTISALFCVNKETTFEHLNPVIKTDYAVEISNSLFFVTNHKTPIFNHIFFRRLQCANVCVVLAAMDGNRGVVHLINDEKDLNWMLNVGPHKPYIPILNRSMFTEYVNQSSLLLSQSCSSTGVTCVSFVFICQILEHPLHCSVIIIFFILHL